MSLVRERKSRTQRLQYWPERCQPTGVVVPQRLSTLAHGPPYRQILLALSGYTKRPNTSPNCSFLGQHARAFWRIVSQRVVKTRQTDDHWLSDHVMKPQWATLILWKAPARAAQVTRGRVSGSPRIGVPARGSSASLARCSASMWAWGVADRRATGGAARSASDTGPTADPVLR